MSLPRPPRALEHWPFGDAVRIIGESSSSPGDFRRGSPAHSPRADAREEPAPQRFTAPAGTTAGAERTVGGGMHEQGEVTRLLNSASQGDSRALQQVLVLLHERLRTIAHRQLAGEGTGHTLETDGLVHEAYLRLEGLDRIHWRDRQHLLSMAARTMRRVLIDYAEQRRASKRGGGEVALALEDVGAAASVLDRHADELSALDDALARLAELNPRQGQVVECRFFVGLSIEETAAALALSPATVKRDWTAARAWLNRELSP
jgi:RNA polymerase sigma factor (TIGR02999 family)